MSQNHVFSISVGICLLLITSSNVTAGWFGTDFSAQTVRGNSRGQSVSGRMYVSKGRVRTEIEQDGQQLIEIIDPGKGVAWVIEPSQHRYRERSVPKLEASATISHNPCQGVTGAQCRQLPDEILNGRRASKWQLRHNGRERMQWQDAHHGFPIQVVEGGKVVMAMVFVAEEELNGRTVERWRALQQSGSGVVESEQWYDPQLNIAIRQQAQDGSYRELHNIRLGEQPQSLFELPQGYKKVGADR